MASFAKTKNMKVAYNDTDSIFIVLNSEEAKVGEELEKELNQHIKEYCKEKWNIDFEANLLKLKFEKLYKSLLVDTKKRYAGHLIWKKGKVRNEIQIVGLQARRADVSLQTQYLQPKVIELILKGADEKEVEKIIFEEIEKVKKILDYEYISIPVKLGKDKYENNLPKTRGVAYAKKFLDLHLMVGMKPLLIYIKQDNEDALCFEHNRQLENKKIFVDVERMIDRNILTPLDSILTIWKSGDYTTKLKEKLKNERVGQKNLCTFMDVAWLNSNNNLKHSEK
jgi:DNA polymerase elongation subunit (family B)